MAKLPVFKRVLREDLKEAPSWIEKLLYPINQFMESVYNALNKNLTFTENIAAQIKSVIFNTSTSYEDGGISNWNDVIFSSTLKQKASGVLILNIRENNTLFRPETINSALSISWIEIDGKIYIKYITGLKNSTKYFITLLII